MAAKNGVVLAALVMLLAVALGAFGAHGLADSLTAKQLATWQTAVQYHLIHGVAMLALSLVFLLKPEFKLAAIIGGLFGGIVLFSGSLYGWVLTGWLPLVFITPVGGTLWLIVWALLAYRAFSFSSNKESA